jgi:hypothetical protein
MKSLRVVVITLVVLVCAKLHGQTGIVDFDNVGEIRGLQLLDSIYNVGVLEIEVYSQTELKAIPFSRLDRLQSLVLSFPNAGEYLEDICAIRGLEELAISTPFPIDSLPESLCDLVNLRSIDINIKPSQQNINIICKCSSLQNVKVGNDLASSTELLNRLPELKNLKSFHFYVTRYNHHILFQVLNMLPIKEAHMQGKMRIDVGRISNHSLCSLFVNSKCRYKSSSSAELMKELRYLSLGRLPKGKSGFELLYNIPNLETVLISWLSSDICKLNCEKLNFLKHIYIRAQPYKYSRVNAVCTDIDVHRWHLGSGLNGHWD